MIFKKLSPQELELIANRGDKSVVEVLGLRSLLETGKVRADRKLDVQKELIEW